MKRGELGVFFSERDSFGMRSHRWGYDVGATGLVDSVLVKQDEFRGRVKDVIHGLDGVRRCKVKQSS